MKRRKPPAAKLASIGPPVRQRATVMPEPPQAAEQHYTVAHVAASYEVDPKTVLNWVKCGALRAVRKGRLIRIPHSALTEFDGK